MVRHVLKKIAALSVVPLLLGGTMILEEKTANESAKISWADSVFRTLSLEEKIAQLMMIRAYSNKDESYNKLLLEQVEQYQVGGVCFFQGGPVRQAELSNSIQTISKIPVMIGIDGEWGLAMRLDSIALFPRQMALGAGRDFFYIYKMGWEIATQCKRMGVHVNFAPCVDVNSNAKNPVIGSRSFGSNPQLVAQCGIAYTKGMQDNGVMACGKHFPGHGDTEADSHYKTPTINHDVQRLKEIELYPFKKLIKQDIDGIMAGHLLVPALDEAENTIATTSHKMITELLQKEMLFKGLIFTDGLDMKGISDLYETGELEVRTLIAGCDVLLLPGDLNIVISKIKEAIEQGRLSVADIDRKCLKVLKMKEKYVLPNASSVPLENLVQDINSPQAKEIYSTLTQRSITVLQNKNNILPLSHAEGKKIVHLRGDNSKSTVLQSTINNYIPVSSFQSVESFANNNTASLLNRVKDADYVIVSLHNTSQYAKNQYGLSQKTIQFLDTLTKMDKEVILVVMSNPYCLNYIPFSERFSSVILAYHPVAAAEEAVAKTICGVAPAVGKLPVLLDNYPINTGVQLKAKNLPKTSQESNVFFSKIDETANNGIKQHAYPGCRILIAHKNKIVYNKSFGTHTYETNSIPVTENTLYDLASITKVAATTLAVMKLYDEGKIDVNDKLSEYLPYVKNTDKESITIAALLTHTAGLQSWIPFYKRTFIESNTLNPNIYHTVPSFDFQTQVCRDLYIKDSYRDTIIAQIVNSKRKNINHYLYSDLGFYLLADLVRTITGKTIDIYVEDNFYRPMGLTHILFNPLERFELSDISPTENDTLFRKTLIHGYVHDQGAAMLGGVSGHAGLFATANDLFALAEMLLNNGVYKHKTYLSKKTVNLFTSYYFNQNDCRRGLGFDKPTRGNDKSPCSKYASPLSYGHSGFAGTFIWIDPQYDLVYIFLSNRIHPDAENKKITEMNIRTNIQDIIYQYLTPQKNSTHNKNSN
ncbi:MAG: serine hydrolase [Bacteroidales bacterium]|jgi:beta-glucosidase-like glycosyl hydrolase/CubicO group peptidase (beta-lactamase class C family)|nr:serine hydrolase [Bacteroidales bacterium]